MTEGLPSLRLTLVRQTGPKQAGRCTLPRVGEWCVQQRKLKEGEGSRITGGCAVLDKLVRKGLSVEVILKLGSEYGGREHRASLWGR